MNLQGMRNLKILCIGDSLTYGNVGYSYIPFLNKNILTSNKGINGETLYGVSNRLKKILDSDNDFDIIILGIGANDVLLPYLKEVDSYWKVQMSFRCKFKKCIENDLDFARQFEALVKMIKGSSKKAIIWGIPYMNLTKFPNDIVIRRNQKIKLICENYGYDFIDIYTLQNDVLPQEIKAYSWKWSFLTRISDAISMTLFPESKNWFANKRGLVQTVDGVHFSSKTASILAKEMERKIVKKWS